MRAFSLLVFQVLPIHLQSLHVAYDTLTCTLRVYIPTVWPVTRTHVHVRWDVREALVVNATILLFFARKTQRRKCVTFSVTKKPGKPTWFI